MSLLHTVAAVSHLGDAKGSMAPGLPSIQGLPANSIFVLFAVYAVMRCLSVCLSVTFVYSVKSQNEYRNHILKMFSPLDSHTILVFFRTKRYVDIPIRTK